jgi:hypothetical protein
MEITTRSGVTLDYDENDWKENLKLQADQHFLPTIEFYLKNNTSSISKALIANAGLGLYSKILDNAGIQTINIEPVESRFNLLESNVPNGTNYQKACSNISGSGTINYFADNKSGAQLGTGIGDTTESVDVITIDSLNLTDLDLLVVIANGQEVNILKGAVDTIANNTNMKLIIYWNTLLYDEEVDFNYIVDNFTAKVLHINDDDSILLRELEHNDLLKTPYEGALYLE